MPAPLVSSEKPIKAYEECMRCSGSTAKLTAGAEARTQYRRPACALGSRHLARRASGEASGQKQRTNKRCNPQAHTSAFASRRGTHDECIVPTHSRPCRSHLPSLKRMPGPPGSRRRGARQPQRRRVWLGAARLGAQSAHPGARGRARRFAQGAHGAPAARKRRAGPRRACLRSPAQCPPPGMPAGCLQRAARWCPPAPAAPPAGKASAAPRARRLTVSAR